MIKGKRKGRKCKRKRMGGLTGKLKLSVKLIKNAQKIKRVREE
jgi:hypothetical protein